VGQVGGRSVNVVQQQVQDADGNRVLNMFVAHPHHIVEGVLSTRAPARQGQVQAHLKRADLVRATHRRGKHGKHAVQLRLRAIGATEMPQDLNRTQGQQRITVANKCGDVEDALGEVCAGIVLHEEVTYSRQAPAAVLHEDILHDEQLLEDA